MIVIDKNEIKVINYERLISIDEKELILIMKKTFVYIYGRNLLINYYDKYELRIKGIIEKVEYKYEWTYRDYYSLLWFYFFIR